MAKKIVRRTRRQVYDLWIKALRSGEYKQGRNRLKRRDRFCCAGVLCDLAAMNDEQGLTFAQIADYIETTLLPRVAP